MLIPKDIILQCFADYCEGTIWKEPSVCAVCTCYSNIQNDSGNSIDALGKGKKWAFPEIDPPDNNVPKKSHIITDSD